MKILLIALSLSISAYCSAQEVQHNFSKGPENTDCQKLDTAHFTNKQQAIETITRSTFRVKERLKLSDYRVPNAAYYYSCNGEVGFLIVKESKDSLVVYDTIPYELWSSFSNSNDPIYFYQEKIKSIFSPFKTD